MTACADSVSHGVRLRRVKEGEPKSETISLILHGIICQSDEFQRFACDDQ